VHTRAPQRFIFLTRGGTGSIVPASYIPLRGRAKAVTVVFVVMVLVYAVAVWSSLLELQLMNRIIAGTQVTDAELASNDSRQLVIQALVFLFFAAGAIVFIGWLWAAYKNIDVVAPSERRYSESWAIFGWFVPILALVRPMKVVNDVWYAGSRDSVDAQPSAVILSGGVPGCSSGSWASSHGPPRRPRRRRPSGPARSSPSSGTPWRSSPRCSRSPSCAR
jgi:hypothetical protein